jgi:orotate phosphoribosyltransferase
MQDYQQAFIEFLYRHKALLFGDFTLKSGRKSPYFFNLGLFNSGESLLHLGEFYAAALQQSGFQYDMLFGPAYKGIPLVSATAIGLYTQYQKNVLYSFNRKEKKAHGDQGDFVGAPLQGKVVMVDDVISAGTTVRETLAMMARLPVQLTGILIAFDRQERGEGLCSAVQQVVQEYRIPVYSIITLQQVMEYIQQHAELQQYLPAVMAYRAQYGVSL